MFKRKQESIQAEIDHCLRTLGTLPVGSEDYKKAATNLELLCKARAYKSDASIDWGIVITCGTAFLQTLMIINHEHLGVVSSKAVGWLLRLKT